MTSIHDPRTWPFLLIGYLYSRFGWHRYALPGKTRIGYDWSLLADTFPLNGAEALAGTGIVVSFQYTYVGGTNPVPYGLEGMPSGAYLHNSRFPKGYIVKPDDNNEDLRYVPQENAQFISGYRRSIPALHDIPIRGQRVSDLPHPPIVQPGDKVRLASDPSDVKRRVGRIFFTFIGTPVYEVFKTKEEARAEKDHQLSEGRAYVVIHDGDGCERYPLGWYKKEEIAVVS